MWFEAKIEQLSQMLAYVRQEAAHAGIRPELINKLELASEEALVNIISYAFSPQEPGVLEITCIKKPTRFEVVLKDHGQPFNPIENHVDLQKDVPLQERTLGGLGLVLIRKLMDESVYRRLDNENILTMTLRLDEQLAD